MLSFATIVDRALNGPICTERDFELGIFVPNLRRAVEKYGIRYDPQNPVPADDDLADRVWEAGLEFLVETGVYCPDTERRILLTREEIEAALAAGPRGRIFGEGKDARVMPRRFPEDETPPWCSGGGGACPVSSDRIFLNLVKAYAEDPLSDGISTPCLTELDGRQIITGSPQGVEGAIRTVLLAREALRRAGRPGMPIVNQVATAVRAQEHISGNRFGGRNTDAMEIGTISEMKVNFDSLNRVAYALANGNLIFNDNGIILGGFSGGPAGTAVVTAAYNMVDLASLRGAVQHPVPTQFEMGPVSSRETLWIRSLATQAAARNSPLPVVHPGYLVAGPMTEMSLYEAGAWVTAVVASGGSIEAAASAGGSALDYTSPVEAVFANGVAHATAGMSRREANKIVLTLLEKYEGNLRNPPIGRRYQECCHPETGEPVGEFLRLYRDIRREMSDRFGLKFLPVSPYL
ncbi:MAG: monomethylamine:corrinoid methyltransferase [Dehalococcoidales bacterium]